MSPEDQVDEVERDLEVEVVLLVQEMRPHRAQPPGNGPVFSRLVETLRGTGLLGDQLSLPQLCLVLIV